MTGTQESKEYEYLDNYVFYGLINLNDGFDFQDIKYFSEPDFSVVLERVNNLALGIYGIETWKAGDFYGVLVHEQVTDDPTDPTWYKEAFETFRQQDDSLLYAATYYIPNHLLK